jgi:gliding motility-associated-like protein
MKNNFFVKKILILFLFVSHFSYSQLNNFILTVNKIDETCAANGSLTFNVSGISSGSTIVYEIYRLPNLTSPISTTSANSLNSLIASTYRIKATQTLGSLTNFQTRDIVINSLITPLIFNLTGINASCGNNGQIIVNTTSGTAINYEIFFGPTIKPLQTSNIFTGLAAGQYIIRVFNSCGEGIVQTFTLGNSPAGLNFGNISTAGTCTSSTLTYNFSSSSSSVISYPLNITLTINPPSGNAIIYSQTINSSNSNGITQFQETIPLSSGQSANYSLNVTDGCGNIYNQNGTITPNNLSPASIIIRNGCLNTGFVINNVQSIIMIAAPAAFPVILPFNYTSQLINNSFTLNNVPTGSYQFNVIDLCGVPKLLNINLITQTSSAPSIFTYPGCSPDLGAVNIFGALTIVKIISAPSAYPNPLPFDLTSSINLSGLSLNNLPIGNYIFQTINNCNVVSNLPINVLGYQLVNSNINIIQNCGSFDINLNFNSNTVGASYWLQKLNPLTNQWGNPQTGIVYTNGTFPTSANSIELQNNSINYNFNFTGDFRILMTSYNAIDYCYLTIKNFNYNGLSKINDVYSFNCNNNTFDVVVDASGIGNLIYRITTKNGLPFVIQNGGSNNFFGLSSGLYNFQVQDSCGNIVNRQFSIPVPLVFSITASALCAGQTGSLTVPNFSFLQYEWWKDNNTSNILSNTNVLTFNNFNAIANGGNYHLRVIYPGNPSSCINLILDYSISTILNIPNAGQDNTISYCGNQGIINLSSLIIGNYVSGGIWVELSSSGVPIAFSSWNSSSVAAGNYRFKYLVLGTCNTQDESIININIKPIPNLPTISVNPTYCTGENIQFAINGTLGATYSWIGPNGFLSNVQNPIITNCTSLNSGNYNVTVTLNGCSLSGNKSLIINSLPVINAGQDNTINYCGTQGIISLFSIILGNYDQGGVWSEISSSGVPIVNNSWNSTNVASGNYQFKYKINSFCNTSDESIINILIKNIPDNPIINVSNNYCANEEIQFNTNPINGANYLWTGPNNFSSNLQNPKILNSQVINSGIYELKINVGGCFATSFVTITIKKPIEFELSGNCVSGKYTILSNVLNNSFNPNLANYLWTGPNNFVSNNNFLTITDSRNIGTYNLQITNIDGCFDLKTIEVLSTTCFIQQGISPNNDGLNENFDLSNFGENINLEVFNRYGLKVYEQNNYSNQWRGQDFNDNLLPDATYYYCIKPNIGDTKIGWIYLNKEIK